MIEVEIMKIVTKVNGKVVLGSTYTLGFYAASLQRNDTVEHDGYSLQETPQRSFEVPDVLEVQVVASDEVRMVPDLPTATKVLFPQIIPLAPPPKRAS